jgi:CO/xanthine dehydrogenase FAD-binding subunit
VTVADLASVRFGKVPSLAALVEAVHEMVDGGRTPVLLAGGTDWLVEQEMRAPFTSLAETDVPFVIDVSGMQELRGIELRGDVLRIGAAATYLEMRRHPVVLERAPMLDWMARDVGAIQIQARGTLGGNLATASPAADGVAALAAYDAVIVTRSVRGERRIPFPELQTGYKTSTRAPDEVIVAVELPLEPGSISYWRKVGTRRAQAISKVALAGVAVVRSGQVTRCGLGMASVGPVTALLPRTRELFLSTRLASIDEVALDKAVEADISPIDDIRSTRGYRLHVAKSLVREFCGTLKKN